MIDETTIRIRLAIDIVDCVQSTLETLIHPNTV